MNCTPSRPKVDGKQVKTPPNVTTSEEISTPRGSTYSGTNIDTQFVSSLIRYRLVYVTYRGILNLTTLVTRASSLQVWLFLAEAIQVWRRSPYHRTLAYDTALLLMVGTARATSHHDLRRATEEVALLPTLCHDLPTYRDVRRRGRLPGVETYCR